MKYKLDISKKYTEEKIIVCAPKMNPGIKKLTHYLENFDQKTIIGEQNKRIFKLNLDNIIRFYSENKSIVAVTETGKYKVDARIYTLEQDLKGKDFIRISRSEIVNKRYIKSFDLSFTGTIRIYFTDRSNTFVSRRYISKVRKDFGI